MRFSRLVLRGLGPFATEQQLYLDTLAGPLVAISGPNGAGKSVLLESLAGAIYRRTPTRGSLSSLAVARDAFAEVDFAFGEHAYSVRQTVDSESDKGESLITEGGRPVVASGKRRDADRWVAEHLPPAEVLYSSIFGAQGSGGFLDLDPAPRKAVVMRVLGHDRLAVLSRAAGERARAAQSAHATAAARVDDERARTGDTAAIEVALFVAQGRQRDVGIALAAARVVREEAQEKALEHASAVADYQAAIRGRIDIEARHRAARGEAEQTERLLDRQAALLDRAGEIRAAAEQVPILQAEVQAGTDAEHERHAAAGQLGTLERGAREARGAAHAAEARARAMRVRLLVLADAEADAAALADWQADVATTRQDLAAAEQDVDRLRALQLDGAGRRITGLRGALETIGNAQVDDPSGCALDALYEDEQQAVSLVAAPDEQRQAVSLVAAQRTALAEAEQRVAESERAAVLVAQLRATATEAEALEVQVAEARAAAERLEDEAQTIRLSMPPPIDVGPAREALRAAQALAGELPQLAAAEALAAELRLRLAGQERDADALAEQLAALRVPPAPGTAPDATRAEADVQSWADLQRTEDATAAVLAEQLDRSRASAARVVTLEAERDDLAIVLGDWRLLERDLGRDGIQALELDAAGPELTELANDLLHSCLGSRFSVRIESSRTSADGKKDLEGCWVQVFDGQANREAEAKTFSGGERVLVGEAVNLAIAMIGVRRAGMVAPTIVRDETGAALDSEKGAAYIAMLRRAAVLVGASKVLFVSHSPELQSLADSVVVVRDGQVIADGG